MTRPRTLIIAEAGVNHSGSLETALALVDAAAQACFARGFARAYLCARAERTAFYQRLGWTLIEEDVGRFRLGVFIRDSGADVSTVRRSPP